MTAPEKARLRAQETGRPVFTQVLSPEHVERLSGAGGPLAGVPFVIKDNLDLQGVSTTCGSTLPTAAATATAAAVERLLEAGAVPVAKTNLDQYATGLVGTRSPFGACSSVDSPLHVSGGSSSGSALAVALGIVPLALGTDTAGSGRVPAAFNGLVGAKPSRGLVSTRGLLPACRSLDCVTTFTRTVSEARAALEVLIGYDPADHWSRRRPAQLPPGGAARASVIGVPAMRLDLDPAYEAAWQAAVAQAARVADRVVEVDISGFLDAGRLLYEGPWVAERYAAFGHLLQDDGPHLDPTVRQIVLAGRDLTAGDAFRGLDQLAALRRTTEPCWSDIDALLLPVVPEHPTLEQVAADPIGRNQRLGTFTNFANLLDLCVVAVPAGRSVAGLPFGVQLIAPAFADGPLLDLAARWCGEPLAEPAPTPGRTLVAVAGAHLSGLPLNPQLVALGGVLHRRSRTAAAYRLLRLPGPGVPRPGLVAGGTGQLDLELWDLPQQGVGALADLVPAPLGLGRVILWDGTEVLGFVATDAAGADITDSGGWRAHLRSTGELL